MGIRFYKPITPGRRGASVSDFAEITDRKKRPEKSLTVRKKKTGGRNNQGKITARHRGGGHKQLYRNFPELLHRILHIRLRCRSSEYAFRSDTGNTCTPGMFRADL